MSAGALALPHLRVRRRRPASFAAVHGALAFDQLGGPLLVVCGLVGGAGTTTLALAIAQQAARESAAPVLLTEREDTGGALAAITGVASPAGVASLATAPHTPPHAFAQLPNGMRMIASGRRQASPQDQAPVASLLVGAREAHGLVVVDAGMHDGATEPLLHAASHVLWVTRADRVGLAHADAALPVPIAARQSLVVTATHTGARVRRRVLEPLAARLRERVVLVPYSPQIVQCDEPEVAQALTPALSSIARQLSR